MKQYEVTARLGQFFANENALRERPSVDFGEFRQEYDDLPAFTGPKDPNDQDETVSSNERVLGIAA